MRISFCIPAVLFYYVVSVVWSNCIPVGTVLFTRTDLVRKCWSESDRALLKARLIMQDVLPDPDCIDFSKPDVILVLLDYFQSCYDIISVSTYGNLQNLMYLALSDALGGYLKAYVLPLTKKAFYAGQIRYSEAKKLFRLYDDIKLFLNTNGLGWSKPRQPCENRIMASPLVIGDIGGPLESCCSQLYIMVKKCYPKSCCTLNNKNQKLERSNYEKNSDTSSGLESSNSENKSKIVNNIKGFSKVKENRSKTSGKVRSTVKEQTNQNNITARYERGLFTKKSKSEISRCQPEEQESCHFNGEKCCKVIVPLPVMDDSKTLHTIAVPFKIRPLRNVQTRKSAYVLVHYYITVIKCLLSKSSSERDIKHFNAEFNTWLVTNVFPHLEDEKWYPAFGAVYRITATIRKMGADFCIRESNVDDVRYLFSKGLEIEDETCEKLLNKERVRDVGEEDWTILEEDCRSGRYFTGAILVLAMVWMCIFCSCITSCCVYNCRKTSTSTVSSQSSKCNDDDRLLNFHFFVKFFKRATEDNESRRENKVTSVESFYKSNKNIVNYLTLRQDNRKSDQKKENRGSKGDGKTGENKESQTPLALELNSFLNENKIVMSKELGVPVFISTTKKPSKECKQLFFPSHRPNESSIIEFSKEKMVVKESASKTSFTTNTNEKTLSSNFSKVEMIWNKFSRKFTQSGKLKKQPKMKLIGGKIGVVEKAKKSRRNGDEEIKDIHCGHYKKCSSCDDNSGSCRSSCITSTSTFSQIPIDESYRIERKKLFQQKKEKLNAVECISIEDVTTEETESEKET